MAIRGFFLLLALLAAHFSSLAQVRPGTDPALPPIQQDPWPSGEQLLGAVALLALLLLLGCSLPGRRRTFRRASRR